MKIEQRSLFEKYVAEPARDPKTLARSTDPQTSHEAAEKLVSSGALTKQMTLVLDVLRKHGPCTSAELAERSGLDRYVVARRLPDLQKRQRATKVTARVCSVGGNKATVWKAV